MGIDTKYGRVTTEKGTIGEDEPVVVFRAKDRLLPELLKIYKIMCELAGSPTGHLGLIHRSAHRVRLWQETHPDQVQTPSSSAYLEEEHRRYAQQGPNEYRRPSAGGVSDHG